MDNLELTHWGIKGMKWGRRRYQNKDGSLTPEGKKRYADDDNSEEAIKAKREKLLRSSNAEELYKNRHLLTTQEINERLQRIDTEQRLGAVAAKNKKTALDKIDQIVKYGKAANDLYTNVFDGSAGKAVRSAIKKKLGIKDEEEAKEFDLDKAVKNMNKMSDEKLNNVAKRANTMKSILLSKKLIDENYAKLKETIDNDPNSQDNKKQFVKDISKDVGKDLGKDASKIIKGVDKVIKTATNEMSNESNVANGKVFVDNLLNKEVLALPAPKDDN